MLTSMDQSQSAVWSVKSINIQWLIIYCKGVLQKYQSWFGEQLEMRRVSHLWVKFTTLAGNPEFLPSLILEWVIEAITTSLFCDDIRIVCLWKTVIFHPSVWPPRVMLYQFTIGLAQSCLHVNELQIIYKVDFVMRTIWCMLCSFSIN